MIERLVDESPQQITQIHSEHGVTILHLSNRECIKVPRSVFRASSLHTGAVITKTDILSMCRTHELPCAFQRCAALLSIRAYTTYECRRSLLRVSYHEDVIDQVIERLCQVGYLDDRRFTEEWIRNRTAAGIGIHKIKNELHLKGISSSLTEEVIRSMEADENHSLDQKTGLRKAAERVARGRNLFELKERQKVISSLVRKGFSFSDAKQAVHELQIKEPEP